MYLCCKYSRTLKKQLSLIEKGLFQTFLPTTPGIGSILHNSPFFSGPWEEENTNFLSQLRGGWGAPWGLVCCFWMTGGCFPDGSFVLLLLPVCAAGGSPAAASFAGLECLGLFSLPMNPSLVPEQRSLEQGEGKYVPASQGQVPSRAGQQGHYSKGWWHSGSGKSKGEMCLVETCELSCLSKWGP